MKVPLYTLVFTGLKVHHLATIGGDSTEMCVRRILKTLMTNSLAVKFNWIGNGGKLPFQGLYLRTVIESK